MQQKKNDNLTINNNDWKSKLPKKVKIDKDWNLGLVTNENDKEYKSVLKAWKDEAVQKIVEKEVEITKEKEVEITKEKEVEITKKIKENFWNIQKKIGSGEKDDPGVCTPETWGRAEETACVCADLLDQFGEFSLDKNPESQYLIYYKGNLIGVITLESDTSKFTSKVKSKPGKEFSITGMVKKIGAKGSLKDCIPSFLSEIEKATKRKGVFVASAKGAIGAYQKYGFENLKVSAQHFKYKSCGCIIMRLDIKS